MTYLPCQSFLLQLSFSWQLFAMFHFFFNPVFTLRGASVDQLAFSSRATRCRVRVDAPHSVRTPHSHINQPLVNTACAPSVATHFPLHSPRSSISGACRVDWNQHNNKLPFPKPKLTSSIQTVCLILALSQHHLYHSFEFTLRQPFPTHFVDSSPRRLAFRLSLPSVVSQLH